MKRVPILYKRLVRGWFYQMLKTMSQQIDLVCPGCDAVGGRGELVNSLSRWDWPLTDSWESSAFDIWING